MRRAAVAAAAAAALALAGCSGGDPAPEPSPFARGPYLTRVTETAARLRWVTRGDVPVELSALAPDGTRVAAAGGSLRGLRPGTRYRWSAAVGGTARATGSFTTAPRRLDGRLTFVVFGDYGAATDAERAVAEVAVRQAPRVVVTTGDNSYLVAAEELLDENLFRPLRALMAIAPNYGVVGDHDIVIPAGRRALVAALEWPGGGERYELRYGPLQFVALGLRADRADVAFAARALARPGPAARFVVVHQPPKAGNPILRVAARAGAAAVLSGHLHAYERRERPEAPGVPLLTVGTGGAPANDERTPRSPDARVFLLEFGLLRVDVEPGRVTFSFIDVRGRVRDRVERPLA